MSKLKKTFIFFLLGLLVFVSYMYILHNNMIKNGNIIVAKIESYKKLNKKLPNSIEQIGIQETLEGPFFYDLIDSTTYEVSFGLTLGESAVYNSHKKQWIFP
jgi:hypothetical protein